MHRTDAAGATVGGLFTDGNPTTGTPATEIEEDWLNSVQEEICSVIEDGAGMTLNKAAQNQLLAAIQALITASIGWSTGDVKLTMKAAADSGWVLMNDGTIGDASSSATTRANADTSALYTLLWNNVADAWAPVTGGRGGSAAADFAAHKSMRLPRALGRALAISGTGSYTSTFTANTSTDELTVSANSSLYTGAAVTVSSTTTLPTGLAAATTYYVIRSSSSIVKLATTLANAHAGTAIDITATGSGTHTITMALTARALGEHLGEEAHAVTLAETAPHTHTLAYSTATYTSGAGTQIATVGTGGSTATSNSSGSGAQANIMQPSTFFNVMIKL